MRAPLAVTALCTALGCSGGEVFACRQTADCSGHDGGRCEPDGWCSFPDERCPSGRRYGHWVGDGLAETCVPSEVADTGSSTIAGTTTTEDSASTSSASGSAGTTTPLTETSTDSSSSPTDPTTGSADSSSAGVPDDGPVAWYRFDEDAFGGVVLDSAHGHDGACELNSCPTPTAGVVGNAAAFDGVDDIVRIADHVDFATDTGFTLAVWARLDGDQTGFRCFVAKPVDDVGNYDSWELGRDQAVRATANIYLGDDVSVTLAGGVLATADWVHVASTWDGAVLRFYVDGVEVASDAADSILLTEHDLYFGGSWDSGAADNFLLGAMDELQIWRRALAPDEVAALGAA